MTSDDHFGGWAYSDPEAPPGTECRCSVVIEGFDADTAYLDVSVEGQPVDVDGSGVVDALDEGSVPSETAVVAPGWFLGATGGTSWDGDPTHRWYDRSSAYLPSGKTAAGLNGTWTVYLSERTRHADGTADLAFDSDCTVYEDITLWVQYPTRVSLTPPPPSTAPGGAPEDALSCSPGATATTTFELVDLPNHKRPAPLAIGGAQRFAHSNLASVTVSAWNGADELKLRHGPYLFVLTPGSPTATVPAGAIPMGGIEWIPARTAGTGTWQNPTVQLTHSCPTTAPTPEPVVQGYALSLATLDSAVSAATGGTGIPFLVTTGTANTWPVYAVRVVNTGAPPGMGISHKLLVELFGTHGRLTLPLVATGADAWTLDVDYSGLSLHGTVTRGSGGLTLSLASGSFGEGSSPLVLQATNLTLPPYPTGTLNP